MQEVDRIAVRQRVALALVGTLVLLLIALLPVALVSVFYNVVGTPYAQVYTWSAPAAAAPDGHVRLHVQIVGIDPWQELVTLRVAGNHIARRAATGRTGSSSSRSSRTVQGPRGCRRQPR